MEQQQQAVTVILERTLRTEASVNSNSPLSIRPSAFQLLQEYEGAGGGRTVEVDASDINGGGHMLTLSKRKKDHKTTILQSSWGPYAAKKGLVPGDQLTLCRIRDEDTGNYSYQIRSKRNVFKLFGKPIWVDVERI